MSLISDIKVIFPDAKVQESYARVKCPYHKGGMERRPSMSILLGNKGGLHAGYAKCFACGWTGSFEEIAKDFGLQYIPDDIAVEESKEEKPPLKLHLQKATYKQNCPYKFSPYLQSRGIDEATQRLFCTYENPAEEKVYFPVFDAKSQYICHIERSTVVRKDKMRYFIPEDAKLGLAYIEEVEPGKPIMIVEGAINALTAYAAGFCRAVATLGATNLSTLKALKQFPGPFFLAFDGDEAGKKATLKALDELGDYKCRVITFDPNADVNDVWKQCHFKKEEFIAELDSRMITASEARERYCKW